MLQNRLAIQASSGNGQAMAGMSLTAQAIKISHALELLETQTLKGLSDYLLGLKQQSDEKKTRGVQTLVNSPEFQASLLSLKQLMEKGIEHPKVEELAILIENEFKEKKNAKIIVFTQFRDTAQVIQERLMKLEDVKPSVFIGQAKKKGSGLSQKEQKQIVQDLKDGVINAIIATSIGEEGLDIAEVSAVFFYEPVPSAIRKIQRAGRTARLSPGKLFILMTQDTKDIANHYASSSREKKMYKNIELIEQELRNKKKNPSLKRFL